MSAVRLSWADYPDKSKREDWIVSTPMEHIYVSIETHVNGHLEAEVSKRPSTKPHDTIEASWCTVTCSFLVGFFFVFYCIICWRSDLLCTNFNAPLWYIWCSVDLLCPSVVPLLLSLWSNFRSRPLYFVRCHFEVSCGYFPSLSSHFLTLLIFLSL